MKKRIEVKDLDDLKLYARKVAIKRGRTIKMLDNDGMWIFKKDGKVFKKEVENGRVQSVYYCNECNPIDMFDYVLLVVRTKQDNGGRS